MQTDLSCKLSIYFEFTETEILADLSCSDKILLIVYCQAENIIVMSKIKPLLMSFLVVNNPNGCSVKYNLI